MKDIFDDDLQAARVLSLANGVAGVLQAAALAIHAIGQAYARQAKITAKSGVKQIDRLLSNGGLDVAVIQTAWVRYVVGQQQSLVVALD